MDSINYSPNKHLNEIFDSPESLNDVSNILAHINQYKLELKQEIESRKAEYHCGTNIDVKQLIYAIEEIKSESKKTTDTIGVMTKSIQDLDTCKKNLVSSMTILQRLQMLINVNNDLSEKLPNGNYKEIYDALLIIKDLLEYFKPYKSIDEINQIHLMNIHTQNKLVDDIFIDFEDGKGDAYGARILSLIDSKYKDKLLTLFFNQNLKEFKDIFTDEAGSLDNLNRRYLYFHNLMQKITFTIFPQDWNVSKEFTIEFMKITRSDLSTRLLNAKVTSKTILDDLAITQEFERQVNSKYDSNFIISSVFEPYLIVWVNEQDSQFNQKIMSFQSVSQLPDELVKDIHANVPNVANSATELFKLYNKVLSQLLKLTKGDAIKDLARLFNKYLYEYYQRILLPVVTNDIKYLTMVLNTSDYIIGNIDDLSDKFENIGCAYQFNKDIYFNLITRTITKLTNIDYSYCWREFSNYDWTSDVSDVSSYMQDVKKITSDNLKLILPLIIRDSYIRTFNDKLIDHIITTLFNNLKQLTITVTICEQILLDLSSLKDLAVKFPTFAEKQPSNSYIKYVNTHFQELENILKLLMVPIKPMENIVESYFELIGDQSIPNFTKILTLKKIENKTRFIDNFKLQLTIANDKKVNNLLNNLDIEIPPKLKFSKIFLKN